MNNNIGDRIQHIIKYFGETQDSFSLKTKISRTSVSKWINGIVEPSYKYLFQIMEAYPSLSGHWLLTGIGDMQLANNKNVEEPVVNYYRSEPYSLRILEKELKNAWDEVSHHKKQVVFLQSIIEDSRKK